MNSDELEELQKITKELTELNVKIETLGLVVAVSSLREKILKGKTKKEQIEFLADLGLSRDIIALLVETTPETVSVRTSELKKKRKVGRH